MRIAIIGSRGVPANYGGFETFAEEIGVRLAGRGHDVSVTCRTTSYAAIQSNLYRGVRRHTVWAPRSKHFETPVSTLIAAVDVARKRSADLVIIVNGINAWLSWILRARGIGVILCVDGIERQRQKWGLSGRIAYLVSELIACVAPSVVVADAEVIAAYYESRYRKKTTVIPYGAPIGRSPDAELLQSLGVGLERYVLYVSRLEPENNADLVIEAWRSVDSDLSLLIVGDAPYAGAYKRRLAELANQDPRVKLMGAIYGPIYRALQQGAAIYVQATSVGGTHPALVESMGAGNAILALDTPENHEVLADAGRFFTGQADLAAAMTKLLGAGREIRRLRQMALERARTTYSWESVTKSYEALFQRLQKPHSPTRGQG